jgi:tetratricopeptide (TPR) repeat protein
MEEAYTRLLEVEGPSETTVESIAAGPPPLVGRAREWESLREAWARAVEGNALFVVITGEAGIGKSRLAEEFRAWVRQQGFATATSRCYMAAGSLAYAPAVELLRSQAIGPRIRRLDDPWQAELARLLPELGSERPELVPVTPMVDGWQRARLFDALLHAILAEERPQLLVIDDLQWCDQDTLDWLNYVRASRPRAHLLVVGTARSEDLGPGHPVQALLRAARAGEQAVELELTPLSPDETAALVANVSGRQLDSAREERLHRETEGNPLFVVEWVRAGRLDELRDESAGQLPPRALSVLEARLAQLSPAGQELAGLAATVGREFTFDLLMRASSQGEERVVDALDELWRRRIIRERGVLAYDFTHDKLREVAYRRESSARRRLLHRRVAQAMERLHGTRLDDVSAQLAEHYERAGWFERAIGFYSRAAVVAQRVFANEEVIELLSRALELLQEERSDRARDARELEILTTLGVALVIREGYGTPAVIETYTRARECCERLGQPPTAPVLRGIGLSSLARGELRRAHELATQLLELGVNVDDPMIRVEGNYLLGVTSFWLGDLADARDRLQEAIAEYVPQRARPHLTMYSQDPRVICLSRLAYTLWHLGDSEEATDRAREALQLAEQLEHPFSIGYALTFASWLAIDMGDVRRARELSERLAGLADERQLGFLQPLGGILRGWRSVVDGEVSEGMAMVREGIDDYRRSEQSLYLPWSLRLLAEMCIEQDMLDAAQAALSEALEVVEATDQRFLEADLLRLSGELVLAGRGKPKDAEVLFTRALSLARRQGAVGLERRAAASLARL